MENVFESGQRKMIPAVLVYLICDDEVLMLHRVVKKNDFHHGKWNGLGGKLDSNESALEACVREIREEAGLSIPPECFRALGVLHFPLFKPQKEEDWMVYVFSASLKKHTKDALTHKCEEGKLQWISRDKVLSLPLWAGDKLFLPLVLQEKSFVGTIWYKGETVERSWIQELA